MFATKNNERWLVLFGAYSSARSNNINSACCDKLYARLIKYKCVTHSRKVEHVYYVSKQRTVEAL